MPDLVGFSVPVLPPFHYQSDQCLPRLKNGLNNLLLGVFIPYVQFTGAMQLPGPSESRLYDPSIVRGRLLIRL